MPDLTTGLRTPKLDHVPEQDTRELLLESAVLAEVKQAYHNDGKTFGAATRAAVAISDIVRQTLFFAGTGQNPHVPLLRSEQLAETAATNCFGHALVASELLEEVGIQHHIAYANQHVFVLLFEQAGERIFMLDPVGFTGEVTKAVGGKPPLEQLKAADRAENTLYTDIMLQEVAKQSDPELFRMAREWMSFAKTDDPRFMEDNKRDYRLQLLSYDMEQGRTVMRSVYDGIVLRRRGDIAEAARAYRMLPGGLYPDIDPRNGLKEARGLMSELIQRGLGGAALQLAGGVERSLLADDSSKNCYITGDARRGLSRWYKNRNNKHELLMFAIPLAHRALQEYGDIRDRVGDKPGRLAAGKKQAVLRELQQLQSMLQ